MNTTLDSRFTLVDVIGLGGAASVFEARDLSRRPVAIKLLHEHLTGAPVQRERFEREASISRELSHPNVLRVYEHRVSDAGDVFLVMELLDGVNLRNFMKNSGGRLPIDQSLEFTRQILSGLDAIHSRGVIHRDLKPDNVFVTRAFEIKLFDFGVARLQQSDDQLTQEGAVLGTPAFMAPEQARGRLELIDARTDLFSLGATLYAMLTGELVHRAKDHDEALIRAATAPPDSIARVDPDLPVPVVELVDRALSFNPNMRFQSAAEMLAHVRSLAPHETTTTQIPLPAPESPSRELPREVRQNYKTVSRLRTFFRLLGGAYAEDAARPELTEAHAALVKAARKHGAPVRLDVTPYSFELERQSVWEPTGHFEHTPYTLYTSGVRAVTIDAEVSDSELRALATALSMTPGGHDVRDAVTWLWERDLQHVTLEHVALSPSPSLDARESLARERNARHDALRAWASRSLPRARARAEVSSALEGAFSASKLLQLTRALNKQGDEWRTKLPSTIARMFYEAARTNAFSELAPALTSHLDAVATTEPLSALELCSEIGSRLKTDDDRARFTRAFVSEECVREIVATISRARADEPARSMETLRALERLLTHHDARILDLVMDAFMSTQGDKLMSKLLFAHASRHAVGHEHTIARALASMSEPYCRTITRMLVARANPRAFDALRAVDANPDPLAKLAVYTLVAPIDPSHVHDGLVSLLGHHDQGVRIRALELCATHAMPGLTGSLYSMMDSDGFDARPHTERRLVGASLALANPDTAREAAIARLGSKQVGARASTSRRLLAIDMLSKVPPNPRSLDSLREATKLRPWNTKDVRDAASAALARLERGGRG